MKNIALIFSILLLGFISCDRQKVCTADFAYITVIIKDNAAKGVVLDSFYTKIVSTNKIVRPSAVNLGIMPGTYAIFSDSEMNFINEAENSTVTFFGFIGADKVVEENYVLTQDGCHVKYISGKSNIILNR